MSKPYIRPGSVNLNPGGAVSSVSFQGIYFRVVSETNNGFQMSFDGEQFFPFQKGVAFGPLTEDFNELWFKSLDSALLPNTVTFYYGNVPIQDSRVNIIAESDLATLFYKPYPFILVPFPGPNNNNTWLHGAAGNGDVDQSDGVIASKTGSNFLSYPIFRRSIEWVWPSVGGTNGIAGLSIKDADGNILAKMVEGIPGRLETFPTLNGKTIDAKPLTIKNELTTATDITAFIYETYWLDGQYQYP